MRSVSMHVRHVMILERIPHRGVTSRTVQTRAKNDNPATVLYKACETSSNKIINNSRSYRVNAHPREDASLPLSINRLSNRENPRSKPAGALISLLDFKSRTPLQKMYLFVVGFKAIRKPFVGLMDKLFPQ